MRVRPEKAGAAAPKRLLGLTEAAGGLKDAGRSSGPAGRSDTASWRGDLGEQFLVPLSAIDMPLSAFDTGNRRRLRTSAAWQNIRRRIDGA